MAKVVKEQDDYTEEINAHYQLPEGSPDWCGHKNAQEIINEYLFRDVSENYSISKLLGVVEFKGGSYGAADIDITVTGNQGHGQHYGTVYFTEDASDVWIHVEMYEGIGMEVHFVDGEKVEEIKFGEQ